MDFEIEHDMVTGSAPVRAAAEAMPFNWEPSGNFGV
jgi:hypothetical protein